MAEKIPEKPTCFVAMPITTPPHLVANYAGDADHFRHVYECLFEPAITLAGFTPIPPTAKGSEVIHGDIITHLRTAALVLMDMSALNANAFFEWGIRTSLNLPVCVVRDEFIEKPPFDAAPINSETYNWRMDGWILKSEISKLAEHIGNAWSRSNGANALWKHFGFIEVAQAPTPPKDNSERLDFVISQMADLNQRFVDFSKHITVEGQEPRKPGRQAAEWRAAGTALANLLNEDRFRKVSFVSKENGGIVVDAPKLMDVSDLEYISRVCATVSSQFGVPITVI